MRSELLWHTGLTLAWREDLCEWMGLAWCAQSGAWWHLLWGDEVCRGEGVRCAP